MNCDVHGVTIASILGGSSGCRGKKPRTSLIRSPMFNSNKSNDVPSRITPWRWVYRILRWTTIATGVITVLLVMHKAPAPYVTADLGAGERLGAKLQQLARASVSGV